MSEEGHHIDALSSLQHSCPCLSLTLSRSTFICVPSVLDDTSEGSADSLVHNLFLVIAGTILHSQSCYA